MLFGLGFWGWLSWFLTPKTKANGSPENEDLIGEEEEEIDDSLFWEEFEE